MRSAKSRKEIVERVLIRQIDDGESNAPIPLVMLKQVVLPQAEIEEIPLRDTRRVVVGVLSSRGGDL